MEKSAYLLSQLISISNLKPVQTGDLKEAGKIIGETLLDSLEVDRVSVWKLIPSGARMEKIYEAQESTLTFKCGTSRIEESSNPEVFEILRSGEQHQLISGQAREKRISGPQCRDYPFNSVLVCPFMLAGKSGGVIICESESIHEFSAFERLFIQAVAEVLNMPLIANDVIEDQEPFSSEREAYLEGLVTELSTEMRKRKRQLTYFSHLHAHMIRGPICRLIGLNNLLTQASDTYEILELRNLMATSISELNEVSQRASMALNDNIFSN